ncbi:MAG TPA: hypothetical protein VND93_16005 [Myxococcales bacterium]|jgi:hypothetical protein|nr:hypothetical protein [Myxococcales bacterium]
MAAKGKRNRKVRKIRGQLARRRSNAAYRRANQGRVEEVQSAIETALAEGAKLRDEISRKIGRRMAAAEAREKRSLRLRRK